MGFIQKRIDRMTKEKMSSRSRRRLIIFLSIITFCFRNDHPRSYRGCRVHLQIQRNRDCQSQFQDGCIFDKRELPLRKQLYSQ